MYVLVGRRSNDLSSNDVSESVEIFKSNSTEMEKI